MEATFKGEENSKSVPLRPVKGGVLGVKILAGVSGPLDKDRVSTQHARVYLVPGNKLR